MVTVLLANILSSDIGGMMGTVMPRKSEILPGPSSIGGRICTVRGQAVMLDSDLAEVYEVTTSALNQAVRRNERRFPSEFSFQLVQGEWDALRSQIVIVKMGRGRHRKYPPRVFTESGAVALAMVLDSDRVIAASITNKERGISGKKRKYTEAR